MLTTLSVLLVFELGLMYSHNFLSALIPPRFVQSTSALSCGRFEAPLEPLQILTWILLLIIVGGFYAFIVPALDERWSIVAGVVYGMLVSATTVAGVVACWKDPIDPNVRRFHRVR